MPSHEDGTKMISFVICLGKREAVAALLKRILRLLLAGFRLPLGILLIDLG